MANIINTRSPFYMKVYEATLFEAKLELKIWEGLSTDTQVLRYTIQKSELEGNNYVVFEISELIRDYIETKYDGEYDSYAVWVHPVITAFDSNGDEIPEEDLSIEPYFSDFFIATEGYGYFEEGINPDFDKGLMMSEGTIYMANSASYDNSVEAAYRERISEDDGVFEYNSLLEIFNDRRIAIPVYAETTNTVTFKYRGNTVRTFTISDNGNTNQKIQYPSLSSGDVDEVEVNYTKDSITYTTSLNVKTFDCSKYEPIRVTFVNKFGALQDMYFTRRNNESINVQSNDYKASVMDFENLTYDTTMHQQKMLNLVGKESITLNTDYIDESCNEHIKQLMLSEQVWMTKLTDEEKIVPIKLKTKSLQTKTRVNDKLVQYTVQFDMAFDKINTVR